ncbi:RNase H family protein [Deinococcus sonorensis]|uniref:RNase H family protein n=2 Tax=Deinococcus sonorensis TaxID=309891 RepID=A0AAU7UDG5_9DEIO
MNHAYVDGSYDAGVGGWGVVLIRPGQPQSRIQGRSEAEDNNATELRAMLEAVRQAPAGERLTAHTDNTSVIRSLRVGSQSAPQDEMAAQVRLEAAERGLELRVARVNRDHRHMQTAHLLANDARRDRSSPPPPAIGAEAVIEQAHWQAEARVSLRRAGERVTLQFPVDPVAPLPPTVQVLIAVLSLAQPQETLLIRRASRLAQAIWERPVRALEGEARDAVQAARSEAAEKRVQVLFEEAGLRAGD